MKTLNITQETVDLLADYHTPVELYIKLRDRYQQSTLLESSDYQDKEDSYSFLAFDSLAHFSVTKEQIEIALPNQSKVIKSTPIHSITQEFEAFQNVIQFQNSSDNLNQFFFGYTSYDAIELFEPISIQHNTNSNILMEYHFFRFVIIINHFNNEMTIIENKPESSISELATFINAVKHTARPSFSFNPIDQEISNYNDSEFKNIIEEGKQHCQIGNTFQVVLSRQFQQKYKGDDFNVYRALRSINPSPYLFYFDLGHLRCFGSSPEAQLKINHQIAQVNPIAGTFKRTGNQEEDQRLAEQLDRDPKENAEHMMLVDLARNDLGKSGVSVSVDSLKKTEFYSHVIHLVSKVSSVLPKDYKALQVLGETYPAGTLSGAPKLKAMQIIDELENTNRHMYGGAIGFIGFDGSMNHAIFIRSFISKNNTLTYQAGAGITINSDTNKELEEVNHKISALRKAIQLAKNL